MLSTSPSRIARSRSFPWLLAALVVLPLLALFALRAAPVALWAYHLEQAGQAMARGLTWPQPRQADSFPRMTDEAALAIALASLRDAQAQRPQHGHAARQMAYVHLARGEWPAAAEAFEEARRWMPDNPVLAWETGLVYEQMLHTIEAGGAEAAAYEAATPQERLRAAWLSAGYDASYLIARGESSRFRQQYEDALLWYERAALMQPLTSTLAHYRSVLDESRGEQAAAMASLQRAIELDEGWLSAEIRARARLRWGIWHFNQGQLDEALPILESVLEVAPGEPSVRLAHADSYLFQGMIRHQQGELSEAIALFEEALALNDQNALTYLSYGKALFFFDRSQAAETERSFEAALALKPQDAGTWRNMIRFWQQAEQGERASALCERAQQAGLAEGLADDCASLTESN